MVKSTPTVLRTWRMERMTAGSESMEIDGDPTYVCRVGRKDA